MSQEIIQIAFKNWETYNPRSDRKNFSWFRFENNFFSDPIIFSLSLAEKIIFVFLLCEASKDCGKAKINAGYASAILKLTDGEILVFIDKLVKSEILIKTETIRHQKTPEDANGCPTNERTNVTNETNKTDSASVGKIKIETIRDLFDETLGGKGKIKRVVGQTIPMGIVTDFINLTGDPTWQSIDHWKIYFEIVKKSDWLTKDFNTTFSWLLKPENAFKVFQGQYENKIAQADLGSNADLLFDRIIRAGRMNYLETLNTMSEVDISTVDKFGGVGAIFDCTNFTLEKTKAQFRAAYKQAASG